MIVGRLNRIDAHVWTLESFTGLLGSHILCPAECTRPFRSLDARDSCLRVAQLESMAGSAEDLTLVSFNGLV
jgi:hypothetical protein